VFRDLGLDGRDVKSGTGCFFKGVEINAGERRLGHGRNGELRNENIGVRATGRSCVCVSRVGVTGKRTRRWCESDMS
jgi:hypothetical protein